MSNQNVIFRRIGGRLVPIKVGKVAGGAGVTSASAISLKEKKAKEKKGPNRLLQAGAIGLNAASGVITSFPAKGFGAIVRNQLIGFGLDSVGTGLNALSVKRMTGSRKKKIKEFAKAELVSQGVGYSVFGIGLLSNKNVRKKAVQWGAKLIKKVTK